ncbi:MAG: hypothetical protein LBT01_08135 [Spirochaetaceae bacterium]|jgi:hypothetical protein|nr:hypothetical protein [Spirochaetaceae bacterium]
METTEQEQEETTFKEVLAGLRETRQMFQEIAKEFKEIAQQSKETDKKFQETDRDFQEMKKMFKENEAKLDRMWAKTTKQFGDIGNRFGDLAEGMLTSGLLKKFIKYGLDFDDVLRNVEINERGTKRPIAELDWLLLNTKIALLGEAKARLTRGDVDKHITRIKKLATTENGLLGGKTLYGAVAGIKITQSTKDYAKMRGLFVLEPDGDSVRIEAPDTKPAVWGSN